VFVGCFVAQSVENTLNKQHREELVWLAGVRDALVVLPALEWKFLLVTVLLLL